MPVPPTTVLYVNHTTHLGGAERSLIELIAHLDRGRFAPRLALPGGGPLADAATRLGVPVHFEPLPRVKRAHRLRALLTTLRAVLRARRRLLRLIRECGAAIVHANSTTTQLYAAPAARRAGVPSVWHCRDMVDLGWVGGWLGRRSDRVIAVSRAVAERLEPHVRPPDRLRVVLNGIDHEALDRFAGGSRPIRDEFGIPADRAIVVMIAQMAPWKGHALFIEAARIVKSAWPTAVFLLVGDDALGDQPGYVEKLRGQAAQADLRESIVFAGARDDVAAILRQAALLIHPAQNEPFGRAIVEAMSIGTPVVAVRSGGPAEIVRDGVDGLLAEARADALAQAALRLLRDPPLAQRLAQSARERARAAFDVRRTAREIESIYDELAHRH